MRILFACVLLAACGPKQIERVPFDSPDNKAQPPPPAEDVTDGEPSASFAAEPAEAGDIVVDESDEDFVPPRLALAADVKVGRTCTNVDFPFAVSTDAVARAAMTEVAT